MGLKIPTEGEIRLLKIMLQLTAKTDNYYLHLYRTNYAPGATTNKSSFTEAIFSGYSVMTLTRANWSTPVIVAGKGESSYGSQALSWTCGSVGDTIYGYWVEDASDGTVLWAEQFSTARVLAQNDVLNLTPKFTMASE
jgi:hypothetical protein